jgi:hypothetical protein
MRPARILGLLLAALLLPGCEEGQRSNESTARPSQFPDQILTDFEVEMTRGQMRSAEIEAKKGVIYRKRDSMIISELTARLFDTDGMFSSVLRADSGLLRERKKRLLAHGSVHVRNRDSVMLTSDSVFWYGELAAASPEAATRVGDSTDQRYMVAKSNVHLITPDSVHLWTDTLLWDEINRRVATDAFVTIVRRDEDTLRGWGLRSDEQLRTITIQESVTGHIREERR